MRWGRRAGDRQTGGRKKRDYNQTEYGDPKRRSLEEIDLWHSGRQEINETER